jgi:transposase
LATRKLPLDNNASERVLRIITVGRKNFLFVRHEEGGHNLAILQTLCSTCLLHGINPYEYIRDVAVRVRTHPNSKIDELLPMHWKPPPDSDLGAAAQGGAS